MKVLETITDEQALEVGNLFLKSSISPMYIYTFDKIERWKYNRQDGCDSEESVSVYFDAVVREDYMRNHGWKDIKVYIKIVIYDRYHDYTYFGGHRKEAEDKTWGTFWLSNHIEVVQYLLDNNLIDGKSNNGAN